MNKKNLKEEYFILKRVLFVLLSLALFVFSPTSHGVFALPEVGEVVSGDVNFERPDSTTLKINASAKAIINYKSFDIKQNESVIVNLPDIKSEILNRVTGSTVSQLLGSLTCNGVFFLVNPNGILFGKNCRVDTASIIASTLNISNEDFLKNNYNFFKDIKNGYILNQGEIKVANGGYVCLLSSAIENSGIIQADLGTIVLATGEKTVLNLDDFGDISVVIDEPVKEAIFGLDGQRITSSIKNSGKITASGGKIILTAKALNNVFDYAINNSGVIEARSLDIRNGEIELKAEGAPVINTGIIEAGQIKIEVKDYTFINKGSLIATQAEQTPVLINGSISLTTGIHIFSQNMFQDGFIFSDGLVEIKADNVQTLQDSFPINITTLAIIQAKEIRITAKQFGSFSVPLNLNAGLIKLSKTQGDFEILESQGIGTSIMLRGPPESAFSYQLSAVSEWGAIIYNQDASLGLEALSGNILIHKEARLTSINTLTLKATGIITNEGYIYTQILYEEAYSFISTGAIEVGIAYLKNIDNAVGILGDISGIINDTVNINFIGNVNLTGNTTLNADSDANQTGKIIMNTHSLTGNNYNLTLYTGETTTLDGNITGVNVFELYSSTTTDKTYTSTSASFSVTTLKTNYHSLFSRNETSGDYQLIFSVSNVVGGLQYMQNNLDGQYKLANNIDASETQSRGWTPVGTFTGIFDGDNKTITGLYKHSADNLGLFNFVGTSSNSAEIKNIGLINVSVVGSFYIGGLASYLESNSTISNSYVTGTVSGDYYVGGLVGENHGLISNSYATVITGCWSNAGGLVGRNYGSISNSYATGAVTNGSLVGGLVGYNEGSISNSYATGAINNADNAGGLVGDNESSISNSYATGAISGTYNIGGLIGFNRGSISNSYAIGVVSGTGGGIGGLVGASSGTVTNSYYDYQTTGQSDTGKGEPKTTAQMKTQSTFSGWDFDTIWEVVGGSTYPYFNFRAPTITWTGTTSTDWGTAGNWSGLAVPSVSNNVFIPNVSNDPIFDISRTTNNLTIVSGATLTIGTYTITVSGTLANSGTIITSGTGANLVITSSSVGNVTFTNTASALPAKTYSTLALSNGGTALGATTAANLTLSAGTLNMATFDLGVTNITNSGIIRTQSTSATPLTTGKTWGGTVQYDATGGQTVVTGTYNNLTLGGSGAKTINTITVNGILSLEGTATVSAAPTYGASATLQYKGTNVQTTGPELTATIPNLTIDNVNGVILSLSPVISGALTLTNGKFLVTVTVTAGQSKVYGIVDPILAYTVTSGNLVSGNFFSGALSREAGENVIDSPYAIIQNGLTAGANYTITFVSANFAITAKPLTITATGPTKIYGTALTIGTSATNFTHSGEISGETVTSLTLTPDTAGLSATTAAGASYAITPSAPTGTGGFLESNYSVTYNNYNGTVAQKSLIVTATGPTKIYGTALTIGTSATNFTHSGEISGETVTSLTLTPDTAGLSATTAAGASYAITPSAPTGTGGFLESNYSVTYNNYSGTVSKKELTVGGSFTANNKIYDGNTTATINNNSLTLIGVVGAETVTLTPILVFSDKEVGTGKTVSITTDSLLGGGGAGNYNLSLIGAPTSIADIFSPVPTTAPEVLLPLIMISTSPIEIRGSISLPEMTVETSLPEMTVGASLPEMVAVTSLSEIVAGTSLPEMTAGTSSSETTAGTSSSETTAGTSSSETKAKTTNTAETEHGFNEMFPGELIMPKYGKNCYKKGNYCTVVIVFEGKVMTSLYNEEGSKSEEAIYLTAGEKIKQKGEIK